MKPGKNRDYDTSCHPMVAQVAKEMAGTLLESLRKGNDFNTIFTAQGWTESSWIEAKWGTLLEDARQSLAACLKSEALSAEDKDEIYAALVADRSLCLGRSRGRTLLAN